MFEGLGVGVSGFVVGGVGVVAEVDGCYLGEVERAKEIDVEDEGVGGLGCCISIKFKVLFSSIKL